MTDHILAVLLGFLGGAIPGGVHLAWKVRRNNTTTSGSVDVSVHGERKKKQ